MTDDYNLKLLKHYIKVNHTQAKEDLLKKHPELSNETVDKEIIIVAEETKPIKTKSRSKK